jgi:primosomal protein N' (replication factor Y)
MLPRLRPGVRVLVPFGGRKLTGYLVDLLPAGAPAGEPGVLKPIEEVLDEAPVLDGSILDLTRFAADYYVVSWGEMIRAALPGMAAPIRRAVVPTEAGRLALRAAEGTGGEALPPALRDPAARAVLGAAAGARGPDGLRLEDLRRKVGERYRASLVRRLQRDGLLEIVEAATAPGPRPRLRHEAVLIPAAAAPVPPAAGGPAPGEPAPGEGAAGEPAGRAAVRAPVRAAGRPPGRRQQAILAALREAGGRLEAGELRRRAGGAGAAALRVLAARGLLRLETTEEERRPVALRAGAAPEPALRLTPAQEACLAPIRAAIEAGRFESFLLHGVTGSGKTEVYLRAIEAAAARGRRALYLVPEIGLTPLLARSLRARFGDRLAILHSRLTAGERHDAWRRIRDGRAGIVLGPRSAVFAPLADLGIVVVDEEHDASYKQEEYPRYNGRDLALVRARQAGAAAVLGSATPSLESYHRARRGRARLVELPERIGAAGLPAVERVDMRREFEEVGRESILSRRLTAALRDRLARREQSLVLLNRRGFSTFVLCRACGETVECRRCSIALTLHLRDRRLVCHYCNATRRVPESCPACGSPHLHFGGTGTERLEEAIRNALPGARLLRVDRDTVRGRGSMEDALVRVERGEVDVLLGTQMIAKGHDFPNVTLVGVVGADALLGLPDFRAGERTFQLLSQVAGRSGRGAAAGEVVLQAYDPEHHAVRAAAAHDYAGFAARELAYRRAMQYPPFTALAAILVKDRVFDRARAGALQVATALRRLAPRPAQVLGPAPAPLERLRGEYRVQVLLKAPGRKERQAALAELLADLDRRRERLERLVIDVDPVSTL